MTLYGRDEEGRTIIIFGSRWRFPELVGFSPGEPIYRELQRMWEEYTGRRIPGRGGEQG